MRCAWFFIASFLLSVCFTDATEKKCKAVTFGKGKYDVKGKCWVTEPTIPKLEVEFTRQSLIVSKISDIGLTKVCPSTFEYVTKIVRNSETCYVVYPNRQCITYANCETNVDCSKNGSVKSACLPDRHRFFNVWVFCPYFRRFELETLELPQCCTCREYNLCEESGPVTTSPIPIGY